MYTPIKTPNWYKFMKCFVCLFIYLFIFFGGGGGEHQHFFCSGRQQLNTMTSDRRNRLLLVLRCCNGRLYISTVNSEIPNLFVLEQVYGTGCPTK